MTTEPSAGADVDPDGDPANLASKNPERDGEVVRGVDGAAAAVPVQDDPDDAVDPDADPEMLGSGS